MDGDNTAADMQHQSPIDADIVESAKEVVGDVANAETDNHEDSSAPDEEPQAEDDDNAATPSDASVTDDLNRDDAEESRESEQEAASNGDEHGSTQEESVVTEGTSEKEEQPSPPPERDETRSNGGGDEQQGQSDAEDIAETKDKSEPAPVIGRAAAVRAALVQQMDARMKDAPEQGVPIGVGSADQPALTVTRGHDIPPPVVKQSRSNSGGYEPSSPTATTAQSQHQQPRKQGLLGMFRSELAPKGEDRRAAIRNHKHQEAQTIIRSNLMNLCKICVKTLLESSIGLPPPLKEDFPPLRQLLLLLEAVFKHGLKQRLLSKKSYLTLFELAARHIPAVSPLVSQVNTDPAFKTGLGRARALLRMTFQQKVLPDIFRLFTENEALAFELYEPWGFMAGEDAIVLGGLVMGTLNIDCQLDLDQAVLDGDHNTIDYSMFLKDGNYLRPAVEDQEISDEQRFTQESFSALTDQNATLREKNMKLLEDIAKLTVQRDEAQTKVEPLEASLESLKQRLQDAELRAAEAEEKQKEMERRFEQKLLAASADIEAERSTYAQSKTGFTDLQNAMSKQLETERQAREAVEADAEKLRRTKKQLEETVRGMEQEKKNKQQTIETLRKQLKDVKGLNLQMLGNMQELQNKVKERENDIHMAERSKAKLQDDIQSLQTKLRDSASTQKRLELTLAQVTERLKDTDAKRTEVETNMLVERQWRESLQAEVETLNKRVDELSTFKSKVEEMSSEHEQLMAKHERLQKLYNEQDQALLEMGQELSQKALRVTQLEAKHRQDLEKQWADDSQVTTCKGCERPFNVKRRKHHCRNCGGIYCADCSDNRMKLPSSAKPVRICDTCERDLIQRMSTT